MSCFIFNLLNVYQISTFMYIAFWSLQRLCSCLYFPLLLFILEDVTHIEKIVGYQIFAHEPGAEDISDAINEILETKKYKIRVKYSRKYQHIMKETEFEQQCTTHFKENLETLAAESPLILPCKEPNTFKGVVKVMEEWCIKRNDLFKIKGLIVHNLFVLRHLEHSGFTREVLKGRSEIKEFSKQPGIIVYNPQENVLLLM